MKSRVSAKYIRKFAKKYNISITEHLRSYEVKAKYLEMIAEAIIDDLAKEDLKKRNDEVNEELNSINLKYPLVYVTGHDWVMRKVMIRHKRIGVIGYVSFTDNNYFIQYHKSSMPMLVHSLDQGISKLIKRATMKLPF